jgi:hypothetical protein
MTLLLRRAGKLRGLAPFALALLIASPLTVNAQQRDPAAAQTLFERGVEALKSNDWDGACKSFEGSMKLDPSVGAQINLARCAEHNGQVARAWADFKKAKALNAETPLAKRKANVDSYVDGELKKLEARLPWVTLRLKVTDADGKPVAPTAVAGLTITRDDTVVPREGLDVAVPVDPGKHVFKATAPGFHPSTVEVTFAEGARQEAMLALVGAAPGIEVPVPPPGQPPGAPTPPPPAKTESETSPLLWVGIAVGSAGVASLIVAGITGGIAASDRGTLDDFVDGGDCIEEGGTIACNDDVKAEAHDALSRGETMSLVNTVTLFAGAGLAVTGVVLAVVGATSGGSTDEKAVSVVPVVGPDALGVTVTGSF